MSTSYVRELLVALGVDGDTKGLEAFDGALEVTIGLMEVAAAAAAALAAAIAAAAGVAAVAVTDTAAYSKEVEQSAAALGLTTDAYQELLYAASQVGLESEQVGQIFAKLANAQGQMASETDELKNTFGEFGISLETLRGMDTLELFNYLADVFKDIKDPADRMTAAISLFGDDLARKVLPLLEQGSDGIGDMREEAEKLGIVLGEDALDAGVEFANQLNAVEAQLTAIWHTIGVAFLPAAANLLTAVQDWIEAHQELINQKLPEYLSDISDAVIDLTDYAVELLAAFEDWNEIEPILTRVAAGISTVLAGLAAVKLLTTTWSIATWIAAIAPALWEAFTTFQAILALAGVEMTLLAPEVMVPLLLIASALAFVATWFAAVYLVIQDVYTYLAGGDSVVGRVIERYEGLGGILEALGGVLSAFGNIAGAVFNLVSVQAETLGIALGVVWSAIQRVLSALGIDLPDATQFAMGVLDGFASILNMIADVINSVAASGAALNDTLTSLGGGSATGTTSGAAAANNAAAFTASSAAAPTPLSAPATGTAGGSSLRTGDVNVTVQGAGWTEEQVTNLVNSVVDTHLRDAMAAYGGG